MFRLKRRDERGQRRYRAHPELRRERYLFAYAPSGDKFEGLETDAGVYDVLKSPVSKDGRIWPHLPT